MRRLHRTLRAPIAWLALLVLAVPLAAAAQDLQGPGFAYYEAGDLDAPRPGPRAPAMMLMGGRRMGAGGLPVVAEAGR